MRENWDYKRMGRYASDLYKLLYSIPDKPQFKLGFFLIWLVFGGEQLSKLYTRTRQPI